MAAMDELHNLKIEVRNNSNFTIDYPPSGNVQVILLKLKMAITSRLLNICDHKNSYLIIIYGRVDIGLCLLLQTGIIINQIWPTCTDLQRDAFMSYSVYRFIKFNMPDI